jgi:FtsP/CotA-like multicopper oxidase with cupredoxin domain
VNRIHSPLISSILSGVIVCAFLQITAVGQSGSCPRFPVGTVVVQPEDLFSENGVLQLNFLYQTSVDQNGNVLYCFVNQDGAQSPTLHVHPGDVIVMTVTNNVPASTSSSSVFSSTKGDRYRKWSVGRLGDMGKLMQSMSGASGVAQGGDAQCGDAMMTSSSVNVHFHGTNTAPLCHQDEVVRTLINSGSTFQYNLQIPSDEPPGLYWYHPHVHGISEAAVQGGASGAIIVDGLENVNPAVAGMPQQVLVIRDKPVPGNQTAGDVPAWDVSLNYIPVPYPSYTPAVIQMKPHEEQLWRVLNASADTIIDLQLRYDGQPQQLKVVALDGVPTGSQDGTNAGKTIIRSHILLPPAARAEFIVKGPSSAVKNASLMTLKVHTGPDGDNDPKRSLAIIQATTSAQGPPVALPAASGRPAAQRFAGLATAAVTARRKLYFSEVLTDPNDPNSPTNFFITVDGATPTVFSPDNPPAIVTTQGAVEDWTIENRALENHEFHIHQIHFLVMERDGVPVPAKDQQYQDMINIPFWSGKGAYPSVKVRMDFRGSTVGNFVYHCHILGHEDNGMMAIIQVNPAPDSTASKVFDRRGSKNVGPAASIRDGGAQR